MECRTCAGTVGAKPGCGVGRDFFDRRHDRDTGRVRRCPGFPRPDRRPRSRQRRSVIGHRRSVLAWVGLALAACASPTSPSAEVTPREERIVTMSRFGEAVTLSVGDRFFVPRPAERDAWHVDYSADVLTLLPLTDNDDTKYPGIEGWRFQAVARGETEVVFELRSASGPAPPRFVLAVFVID